MSIKVLMFIVAFNPVFRGTDVSRAELDKTAPPILTISLTGEMSKAAKYHHPFFQFSSAQARRSASPACCTVFGRITFDLKICLTGLVAA
jgi:hypothetical protein